jgi:hypothetical protein
MLSCSPDIAFFGCSLENIIIPLKVETIESSCFANCHKLANVFLAVDSEIVRIGDKAFQNCWALESLFLLHRLNSLMPVAMQSVVRLRVSRLDHRHIFVSFLHSLGLCPVLFRFRILLKLWGYSDH